MSAILGPIGARIIDGIQKAFPPKPRGLFIAEDFDNGEYVLMLGSPAGVPVEYGTQGFFRAQRAQGVHWVTDPTYGATGDGIADDTSALQAAITAVEALGGGTVFFPKGMFRTTAELVVTNPNVRFAGVGKRNIQVPLSTTAASNVPSTIFANHTGNCVRLPFTSNVNGFSAEGLTFLSASAARAARCFAFDLGGASDFRRDFVFRGISVQGFTEAFSLYASTAETGTAFGSAGVIRVVESSIMHNQHIAYTATGKHWNSFIFQRNEAGQNGYDPGKGGISVEAHNANISDNVMEGQRDPIIIRGGYTGVTVKNNYFEANVGDACVSVNGSRGTMDIGENLYYAVLTTHKVLLYDCLRGNVRDPYWSKDSAKINLPILSSHSDDDRNLNTDATTALVRVDEPSADFLRRPDLTAIAYHSLPYTYDQLHQARNISPFTGRAMWTFTETQNAHTASYTIAAAAGDWIVVCAAFRRRAGTGDPYINVGINGTTVLDEAPVYSYNPAVSLGEWVIITKAVRAPSAVTSVDVIFYVNGFGGVAVLHDMLYPLVFVVDDVNKVRPYYDADWAERVPMAPTNGTWQVGDRLHIDTPVASGNEGWVCTAAGTPGTWKTFGAISA